MNKIKIDSVTQLSQLNGLIVKKLGWRYFTKDYVTGYIPKHIWEDLYIAEASSDQVKEWLSVQSYYEQGYECPQFCYDLNSAEHILKYFDDLNLHTELIRTKNCSICLLSKPESIMGYPDKYSYIDTYIDIHLGDHPNSISKTHSLPLAICLAFLKHKGITVKFNI